MAEQENSEDPNPYVAVPTSTPEAAQFAQAGNIRLPSIVDTTGKTNFLSRIGQLRMDYSDGQGETRKYNGTATVFSAQRKDDSTYLLYAVTCAHNVQLDDPMKPNLKCRSVTFEVRESSKTGSKALQSFQATPDDWYVHPDYDPQSRIPSHDLAIIQFKVSKQEAARFRNMEYNMTKLDEAVICLEDREVKEKSKLLHIYGFPVKNRGKLSGLSQQAKVEENTEKGIVQYDVPTLPGQSGSPIIKTVKTSISCVQAVVMVVFAVVMSSCLSRGMSWGASFDMAVLLTFLAFVGILVLAQKMGVDINAKEIVWREQCVIAGIHTTGNGTGNMGVKLTKDTLSWMRQCIARSQRDAAADDDKNQCKPPAEEETLYCLKVTPFI